MEGTWGGNISCLLPVPIYDGIMGGYFFPKNYLGVFANVLVELR